MKKNSRRIVIVAAALLIVAVVLMGVYLGLRRPPQEGKGIRIGYLSLAASLPLFVAQDEGLFAKEGFRVELVEFRSGNEMAIAAARGDVDLMVTGATNAVLDAMAVSETHPQVFMANEYIRGAGARDSTDYLLALPGETIASLRGQKIAFFPGSVSRVFASIVLPRHGLRMDEFEYVEMAPGQWLPALKSGQVRAVVAVEPFATMILESGVAQPLITGYIADVFNGVPLSGAWFAGNRLTDDDKQAIVRVFSTAVESINRDRMQALRVLEEYTTLSTDISEKMTLNRWQFTDNPEVREAFIRFAEILADNDGIRTMPADDTWLWQPTQSN